MVTPTQRQLKTLVHLLTGGWVKFSVLKRLIPKNQAEAALQSSVKWGWVEKGEYEGMVAYRMTPEGRDAVFEGQREHEGFMQIIKGLFGAAVVCCPQCQTKFQLKDGQLDARLVAAVLGIEDNRSS